MATFQTNCTAPPVGVNYVTAPNTRGTLDILWSCLSTLLLCTWTSQHLNVPPQSTPRNNKQRLRRKIRRFITKVRWLLVTLMGPEFILGKAFSEWSSVRILASQFKEYAEIDGVEWSDAHTFLANMGGFVIQFEEETHKSAATTSEMVTSTHEFCAGTPRDVPNDESGVTDDEREVPVGIEKDCSEERQSLGSCSPSILAKQPVDHGAGGINGTEALSGSVEVPLVPSSTPMILESGCEKACSTGAVSQRMQPASPVKIQDPIAPPAVAQSSNDNLVYIQSLHTLTGSHPENLEKACPDLDPNLAQTKEYIRSQSLDKIRGVEAYVLTQLADAAAIGDSPWTLDPTHVFLVNLALRNIHMDHLRNGWEKNRCFQQTKNCYNNLLALQGDGWVVDAYQLLFAREVGIIKTLPILPKDGLDDRNKGDALVKGLAVGQVVWLFVQLVVRGTENRTPSQLEIVVLAFAICTFLIYIFQWNKPQDVRTPICTFASRSPTVEEIIRMSVRGPITTVWSRTRCWMPNQAIHYDGRHGAFTKFSLGLIMGALIFGCLHCAAWNFHFPTPVERLLWRIAAILTAGTPLLGAAVTRAFELTSKNSDPRSLRRREIWLQVLFIGPYLLARLYITGEIFRSLCFLAPGTFLTTWSVNIPHIS